MKTKIKKPKIVQLTASFSMKKSLGNYEMADIFFSAQAEVGTKDKPEDVAEQVHTFVKKLAVGKYNSFSRADLIEEKREEKPLTKEELEMTFEKGREQGFRAGAKKAVEFYKQTGKTLEKMAIEKSKEEKGEPGDGYKQNSEK